MHSVPASFSDLPVPCHPRPDRGFIITGFPLSREWRKGCGNDTPLSSLTESLLVILNRKPPRHPQPKTPSSSSTDCPPVILNRKRSASDWGSSPAWIPVFTGMTHSLTSRTWCGIHPLRHPALDAGSRNYLYRFPLSREWRKGGGNDKKTREWRRISQEWQ